LELRILVTGGSGFIGIPTCQLLVAQGHEVLVYDVRSDAKSIKGLKYLEGDVTDFESVKKATKNIDGLLHLAAMSRSGPSDSQRDQCIKVNVTGTYNVLEAAHLNTLKKVVYAGSSTFYGNHSGVQKISDQRDILNFYGLTKFVGEEITNQYFRTFNLPTTILRYFNVYGPGQPSEGGYGLVMGVFQKAKNESRAVEIHGKGDQRRDFIHVFDVAKANLAALTSDIHGKTYNIGSGTNVSILELAKLLELRFTFAPKRAGDAENTLADISETKRDLDWEPKITLEQGLLPNNLIQ
jgi:UDP-glucose 4-epimerase